MLFFLCNYCIPRVLCSGRISMYLAFSYDTSLSFQGKQRFEYIRIIVIQIIRHVSRFYSIKLVPNLRHQSHLCRYVINLFSDPFKYIDNLVFQRKYHMTCSLILVIPPLIMKLDLLQRKLLKIVIDYN